MQTASPLPNSNQWNNTNVTVSCTCSSPEGIQSCTPEQVINQEGANQVVTCVAIDLFGLSSSCNVTLNLDKTAPVLQVTSPQDGTITESNQVTSEGSVFDSLSGIASVTCNGTNASLAPGSYGCTVLLDIGANALEVIATDRAGNSSTGIVHLTRNITCGGPISVVGLNPAVIQADGEPHVVEVFGLGFCSGMELSLGDELIDYELMDETYAVIQPEITAPGVYLLTATDPVSGQSGEAEIIAVEPDSVTMDRKSAPGAGGVVVTLFSSGLFLSNTKIYFDMTNSVCRTQAAPNPAALIQAEMVEYVSGGRVKIRTPRALEGKASVYVTDTAGGGSVCLPDAFTFVTYAFTANQDSSDVSVLDTTNDERLEAQPTIHSSQTITPSGVALNSGPAGGKDLYVVDAASGNLLRFDAIDLSYVDQLQLQADALSYLGALRLAMSRDGRTGYVLHVSSGKSSQSASGGSPLSIWNPTSWLMRTPTR